jgi:hypothetical protein
VAGEGTGCAFGVLEGDSLFNLIVMGVGWQPNQDDFPAERVLEYTGDACVERFKPNGVLDVQAVMNLPTVFMEEGFEDEIARIGTITSIKRNGGSYTIKYVIDPSTPPIPNSLLHEMSNELAITGFEFSRTHWAIKEVNLYEILYRRQLGAVLRPRVFNLPDAAIKSDLVSVMMPFAPQFDELYSTLVETCEFLGLRCQRADDIWLNDAVIEDVVHLIATSRYVIADLSGRNANVFYEVGIAHTLGKDVILITQSHDDIPFDLRHLRYVHYLNNGEGRGALGSTVSKRIQTLGQAK